MQQFFSVIEQALRKNIVILGLVSLLSLSGLFIFDNQPASAFPNQPLFLASHSQGTINSNSTTSTGVGLQEEDRETAYDEATKAIADPKGLDKIYEEDLKAYEEAEPDKGLVETAKELIQDVTGKE